MKTRFSPALAIAICMSGCATERTGAPSAVVTSPHANVIAENRARDAVVVGKSTKADVLAALGEALVIRFENGFEVWLYYLSGDTAAKDSTMRRAVERSEKPRRGEGAELVVLFAPSGIVAKSRIRAAPQPLAAEQRGR